MASISLTRGQVVQGCAESRMILAGGDTWQKSGGYFFTVDASGYAQQATAADTVLSGWIDIGFDPSDSSLASTGILTVPATESIKYEFATYGLGSHFWVPVSSDQALAITDAYKFCDLVVNTSKVEINLSAQTKNVVQILPPSAEEIAAGVARVRINPAKYGQ